MEKRARKSRYGCVLCRKRRIKCNEQKPACSQCSRKHLLCEYQPPELKWKNSFVRPASQLVTAAPDYVATPWNGDGCSTEDLTPLAKYQISTHQTTIQASTCFTIPELNTAHDSLVGWPDMPTWDQQPLSWPQCDESPELPNLLISGDYDSLPECQELFEDPQASPTCNLFSPNFWPTTTQSLGKCHDPTAMVNGAIETPSFEFMVPTRMLSDTSTIFVSYYFRNIGPLFCCSHEIDNPFIGDVAQLWNSSSAKSLPYALQSLSVACLAETTPRLLPVAWELRQKAKTILDQELDNGTTERGKGSLDLSMILLGASAGWIQPQDSMLDLFRRFASLPSSSQHPVTTGILPKPQLFQTGIITYWQMAFTFMSSSEQHPPSLGSSVPRAITLSCLHPSQVLRIHPHPWTGISANVIILLTQVGQLVRHHETTGMQPDTPCSNTNTHQSTAKYIESKLLQHCKQQCHDHRPSFANVELLRLLEMYQIGALLQIYRVFPVTVKGRQDRAYETVLGLKLFSDSEMAQNLLNMACRIINLAIEAGPDSSVLRFQLVPLIIACSELRLPCPGADNAVRLDAQSLSGFSQSAFLLPETNVITVAQARQLAKNHLLVMRRVFPGERVGRVIKVITALWEELDSGDSNGGLHWIKWLLKNGHDVI